MKSFLKKLGVILANVGGIAVGIGPVIQPFLGSGKASQIVATATNDLTQIGSVVVTIETALQGATGTQKLAAVIPLIGNILKTSQLVIGKKIANQALFTQAVQEYAQATVDLLNSIDENEAKTS